MVSGFAAEDKRQRPGAKADPQEGAPKERTRGHAKPRWQARQSGPQQRHFERAVSQWAGRDLCTRNAAKWALEAVLGRDHNQCERSMSFCERSKTDSNAISACETASMHRFLHYRATTEVLWAHGSVGLAFTAGKGGAIVPPSSQLPLADYSAASRRGSFQPRRGKWQV